MINETHDRNRTSWVTSANGHATFPIQNLPFGVFSPPGEKPRGGVAIGEKIFDISAALEAGLFSGAALDAAQAASGRSLNAFLQAGAAARAALRSRLADVLDAKEPDAARHQGIASRLLHDAVACQMHLPARIGDFTDFFAGIHHAYTAGTISRPDNPLMPNYKYVPVAYHSRASSVQPAGGTVRRPNGQRKPPDQAVPDFGPSGALDYELELGVWIGQGNEIGSPIPISEAGAHAAGFCLLNDWSARDIQAWESQPLGPFLAKSLATFVSPWIITAEALEPFRVAQPGRPAGDPAPLPHLNDPNDQARGCFNIDFEVLLLTSAMRAAGDHAAGFCLLNDWSARDIQAWESQPLGPFLAKSLSTFVSPWIITAEALAPFRVAQPRRPAGDPVPLPHLNDPTDQARGCFNIDFEVRLLTSAMRAAGAAPHVLSRANASMLYWTVAQMVAHHTSNGCNLQPGDLFGSGTVSGLDNGTAGCLLEMTGGGRTPIALPDGETRTYLLDGDEVIFRGMARQDGYVPIGFGECRGTVAPAL